MNPDDYIEQRVDGQIRWYDEKSQAAQSAFKRFRGAEIVCAAAIPLLAGFTSSHPAVPVAMGLLGAGVVILASLQSLGQHHENWIAYRATCESLQHEKYLFLTRGEPYGAEDPFPVFVQRVENLMSGENAVWVQHARKGAETSAPRGTK